MSTGRSVVVSLRAGRRKAMRLKVLLAAAILPAFGTLKGQTLQIHFAKS